MALGAVDLFDNPVSGLKWTRHTTAKIYDTLANTGTVFVGATADTPAFAVDCIEKWWRTEGRKRYPRAEALQNPR